jgi:UDP-2,3-diacylglucosamine hydrolase
MSAAGPPQGAQAHLRRSTVDDMDSAGTRKFAGQPSVLQAPPRWRSVEFISDLHLQAQPVATCELWLAYLRGCRADALFILGDLFEVWVGDDAAFDPPASHTPSLGFEGRCLVALREAAARMNVHFMRGNRDFLIGPKYLAACAVVDLDDPTVLAFGAQRYLLSHGDALCLDDTDYQAFRSEVRSDRWQRDFLARPLAERTAIARQIRQQSEAHKRLSGQYADVDFEAALDLLALAQAGTMIHGHTHRPADHALPDGRTRVVLSDWDGSAQPARAQVLRLDGDGLHRLDLHQALGGQQA